jgi:hypothetical protein
MKKRLIVLVIVIAIITFSVFVRSEVNLGDTTLDDNWAVNIEAPDVPAFNNNTASVNNSAEWMGLDSYNTTQMYDDGDTLSILTSWVTGLFFNPFNQQLNITNSPTFVNITSSDDINVGNLLRLKGGANAWTGFYNVNVDDAFIYKTQTSAGSYPFNGFGHLVLQARPSSRDIVLATGVVDDVLPTLVASYTHRVGINKVNPPEALYVNGTTEPLLTLNRDADNDAIMRFCNLNDCMYIGLGSTERFVVSEGTNVANTPRLVVEQGGDVGVGLLNPAIKFHIYENIDGDVFRIQDIDGACSANPESGSVTWTCSSDLDLKENVRNSPSLIDKFMSFSVKQYEVKSSGNTRIGVITDELKLTNPEMVHNISSSYFDFRLNESIETLHEGAELPSLWEMVKVIQELNIKIESLESRVSILEGVN